MHRFSRRITDQSRYRRRTQGRTKGETEEIRTYIVRESSKSREKLIGTRKARGIKDF